MTAGSLIDCKAYRDDQDVASTRHAFCPILGRFHNSSLGQGEVDLSSDARNQVLGHLRVGQAEPTLIRCNDMYTLSAAYQVASKRGVRCLR